MDFIGVKGVFGLGTRRFTSPPPAPPVPYHADAIALFARMTTPPSDVRKWQISQLIKALDTAGVWSKLKVFHVFALHDEQSALLNWKADAHNLLKFGTPTFVADRGFTPGAVVGNYLRGDFNPTVHGGYNLGDAHLGTFSNTAIGGNARDVNFGGGSVPDGISNAATGISGVAAIGAAGVNPAIYNTGPSHFVASRLNGSDMRVYRNGTEVASQVTSPTLVLPNTTLMVGATTSASTPTTRQIGVVHAGSYLTPTQISATNTAIRTFLQACGVPGV
jgi:hypothetical protein